MKQKIIVCDRFLDLPLSVREEKTLITQEISDKIAHLLGNHIQITNAEIGEEQSKILTNPEVDYIGILYLDFPTECIKKQDLSFYCHKSGMENFPTVNEMEWFGLKNSEEVWKSFDFNCENDWQEYMNYFVKYNRFVLFDASLFHKYGRTKCLYYRYSINIQKS